MQLAAEAALALHTHLLSLPSTGSPCENGSENSWATKEGWGDALIAPAVAAVQAWFRAHETGKSKRRRAESELQPPVAKRPRVSTEDTSKANPGCRLLQLSGELQVSVLGWLDATSLGMMQSCCRSFRPAHGTVEDAVRVSMRRNSYAAGLGVHSWPQMLQMHERVEKCVDAQSQMGIVKKMQQIGNELHSDQPTLFLTWGHKVP